MRTMPSLARVVTAETKPRDWTELARNVLLAESEAIRLAAERLDERFCKAISLIESAGKVVVTGLGKSGHVARKIVATLCSTGARAVFLHPAEATHGDLGIYSPGDPTIMISKSGTTAELLHLIPLLRHLESPLIGIFGALDSPLGSQVDVLLDGRVHREADSLNLVPTCSSTVALAIGDAIAVALMQARNFTAADFAKNHPSGQLGRYLCLRVGDVMHSGADVAWVSPSAPLKEVVIAMTCHSLGAACVVTETGSLAGLITDGDLRRALRLHDDPRPLCARDVMTHKPTTIEASASLQEAARVMEDRPSQISVLPVVGEENTCLGLLRIHDLYRSSQSPANGDLMSARWARQR